MAFACLVLIAGFRAGCGTPEPGGSCLPGSECPDGFTCDVAQWVCWPFVEPGSAGTPSSWSLVEVAPPVATIQVSTGTLAPGETQVTVLRVRNAGKDQLLGIRGVTLAMAPLEDGTVDPAPAFALVGLEGMSFPLSLAPAGDGTSGNPESIDIRVAFTRPADARKREATLTVLNDSTAMTHRQAYRVTFVTQECQPALDVPAVVDFGVVGKGGSPEVPIAIVNVGSCPVKVNGIRLDGPAAFSVGLDGTPYPGNAGEVLFNPPIEVAPNSGLSWTARYTPETGDPAQAQLTVLSNDPAAPAGHLVRLQANADTPVVQVVPNPIEFGGKGVGKSARMDVEIRSVGAVPVQIGDLRWKDASSPTFTLIADKLSTGKVPTANDPSSTLVIAPNGTETLTIEFIAAQAAPIDPASGQVQKETGTLVIGNNGFQGALEVEVSGFGVVAECPNAVIEIEEGLDVAPQTVLHLHGDQSQPANGSIAKFDWTVMQPSGNKFNLIPSATFPNPTHEANVAGEYTYCLDVCDGQTCSNDAKCHTTACKTVVVTPGDAIHCELTWETPGDLDPFDEGPDMGADMDLHFVHPFATGPDIDQDGKPDGWFDIPYDVFWFNPHPDWESMNATASDDPSLDRDDTDGSGPENVNLSNPMAGRTYRVAVHYWADHVFGFSVPRVKCYVNGKVALDVDLKDLGQKMFQCDLWEVATIEWPSGTITQVKNPDGSLKITHGYQNPAFVQIGGGTCK